MEFREKLLIKFEAAGLNIADSAIDQLELHWQLLSEANNKFNLTAIKDDDIAIEKHYIDCLVAARESFESLPDISNVADIGSGGGFPGLIFAIMKPDISFTLIESSQKKAQFLEDCAREIKLNNVLVLPIRAEDAGHDTQLREHFDMVIARAVAHMAVLAEYALPLLRKDGVFVALKGPKAEEEVSAAKASLTILGGTYIKSIPYVLPDTDSNYNLTIISKTKNTPSNYPRRPGMPKMDPL